MTLVFSLRLVGPKSVLGPKTEVAASQRDVCSAPDSGHREAVSACPFREEETHAPQQIALLFNHRVCTSEHISWYFEAEFFCRLEVDHQLELGRLFDRQL